MAEPAYDIYERLRDAETRAEQADARARDAERRAAKAEHRLALAEAAALRADTHTALAEARARALTETTRRLRTLVANLPDTFVVVFDDDLRYRIVEGDQAHAGGPTTSMEGHTPTELFPPRIAQQLEPMYRRALGGQATVQEIAHDDRTYLVHTRPLRDDAGETIGGMVVSQDVSRLKETEAALHRERAALQQAVRDRDVLLREVYHRVKNNLQVVSSLLSLQARALDDPGAVEALQACRQRVAAMARVHERLYQSTDLARIDLGAYLQELVGELSATYGRGAQIHVDSDMASVHVELERAIPCGLVLHELVANAFTHAWPDGGVGTLRVRLTSDADQLTLSVADDGLGGELPDRGSLGVRLVRSLTRQLRGTLEQESEGGTTWTLTFPNGDAA